MISNGLSDPGPLTLIAIFSCGLLTSLGPCSLSLLPITVAYLAGFNDNQRPVIRSASFSGGIVLSLVILGSISGFVGKLYGQVPILLATLVSILSITMGLNLIGVIQITFPIGPNPDTWRSKVPKPIAPLAAGLAFGLASSPCTTPVLAVLLSWVAKEGNPFSGTIYLGSFAIGQIIPLFIAGNFAATIPKLLSFRSIGKWVPAVSGVILLTVGLISLLSIWI